MTIVAEEVEITDRQAYGCCHNEKYQSLIAGTLAQIRASTVKKISTILEFTCALNLLIKL